MADGGPEAERRGRALIGVVAASALAYPVVWCAVQLGFAQVPAVDVGAVVLWLTIAVVCSVAAVAVLRWGVALRVRSPWLLVGLVPPAVYELWLVWPRLTS